MKRRITAIVKKELRQLKRDKRMLFVLFIFPLILLVLFGYAISFDVKHIKLSVYDEDRSSLSRDFVNGLISSEYFDLQGYISDQSQIKEILSTQKAQCIIVFPKNFSANIYSYNRADIQILIDGVNATTASIIKNYLNAGAVSYSQKISNKINHIKGKQTYLPVSLQPIFWFNPTLDSTYFLIPGLVVMILIITAVVSISLSIVREKERGTIEQINVSPIATLEMIAGKTSPYILISLLIAAFILGASYLLFGMIIRGNIILLFFTTLLFIFSSSSMGIFVSTIASTQQVAFQLATLSSLLPSVLLSGFIFPIESMPEIIQYVTNITPAKFFLVILRDIALKGVGIEAFWEEAIFLIVFALVFLTLSWIVYNKTSKVG